MRDEAKITDFIVYHSCDALERIDYDAARDVLADSDDEIFDVFVRLAYEFSTRIARFNSSQIARFSKRFANLAVDALAFNCVEAESMERTIDTVNDALQDAR